MANRDGTGPVGDGSVEGRGLGICTGINGDRNEGGPRQGLARKKDSAMGMAEETEPIEVRSIQRTDKSRIIASESEKWSDILMDQECSVMKKEQKQVKQKVMDEIESIGNRNNEK